MKQFLIILLSGGLLMAQAAWARPPKAPPPHDRMVWSQMQRRAACGESLDCKEARRLRQLQLREAERNGDGGFDPARGRFRMPPPPEGHPQTIPNNPNFWQDKHKQELEHNQSE
ncbi:hypothetical protein [Chromobacterium paludis]|uniref:DUF4124 domain-containing protein n=1 Tax=Chromobacterium paludis TaxID=2605945 RepID=A0A5C1DKL9_9NEIS|nr:hypothetical protein [Chromobacterium paludis]QEL57194.1 hypothetical protein FYK34_17325 [Chromobacterium paludis]